jgi:hypothetical protein
MLAAVAGERWATVLLLSRPGGYYKSCAFREPALFILTCSLISLAEEDPPAATHRAVLCLTQRRI